MPHEKINYPKRAAKQINVPVPAQETPLGNGQLVVGWNEIGWVQVSIYPEGWNDTGDAEIVDLNKQELDLLIRTLERARRQAYSGTQRHSAALWFRRRAAHHDTATVQRPSEGLRCMRSASRDGQHARWHPLL